MSVKFGFRKLIKYFHWTFWTSLATMVYKKIFNSMYHRIQNTHDAYIFKPQLKKIFTGWMVYDFHEDIYVLTQETF